MEFLDLGYADERFQEGVNEDLHCPICTNVLKEPVHCGPNEHYFCKSCITRHLHCSQTCPCCKGELSLEKLKPPSRFVTNRLSKLKINCDNFSRGCQKILELGDLDSHVKGCGFSLVVCSNKGCSFSMSKKDREQHECETCPFRRFKCKECTELKQEVEAMKTTLREVTAQLRAMENVRKDFCAEIKDKMKHLHESVGHQNQAEPQDQAYLRDDFIVLGGNGETNEALNSIEIFNWSVKSWKTLKPMNWSRAKFSAVVYKNQILVSGGVISSSTDSSRCPCITDNMEKIDLNDVDEDSALWLTFPGTLPGRRSAHKCIVYQDRLLAVGGHDSNKGRLSDGIGELSLTRPYTSKLGVCRMPCRRRYHGAELFENKIVIVGGIPGSDVDECLDSVLEYDVIKKKCATLQPLPFPVTGFATVVWKDKIVLLGGINKNSNRLSTVVMYDIKTGKTTMLPSMKHKREGCSAIATGNAIIVMGGRNMSEGFLNSVECFSFERYSWTELPPMKERRAYACAVVKTG